MSTSLYERVLKDIEDRRSNVLSGGVNCIPSPIEGYRDYFVGTEQGTYYLISSQQKAGKTQFMSYIFLFNNVLYAYHHPEQVRIKIFYYHLEETPERIMYRLMSYILYELSNHKLRYSKTELQSADENNVLPEEIVDILKSEEYKKIFKFFEDHIIFEESTNPTGVWKDLTNYAEMHGKIITKNIDMVDKNTGEIKGVPVFDHYEPDDPDEYVEIIWDHISLTSVENGMNLRETIEKLSKDFVKLSNKFGYIPVVVQQQSTETQSFEAVKGDNIMPTVAGLADCKYTSRDCHVMLSLASPFAFKKRHYHGYDIEKFKDNIRFLEETLNRNGEKSVMTALYFDGATSYYHKLPKPDDIEGLQKYYHLLERLREPKIKVLMLFFRYVKKHIKFKK